MKPKLLDLFCGAGGASVGYYRAGFEVVGVDINPQPDYPFEFHRVDVLSLLPTLPKNSLIGRIDAIHASPPCQIHSMMQRIRKNKSSHVNLIPSTRYELDRIGLPYIIENVIGAPLRPDLKLCGTMFGLRIIRHRIFEGNINLLVPENKCNHKDVYDPWHGKRSANEFRKAMGIDWMRDAGGGKRTGTVAQAIPPAYTEFIGKQLIEHLSRRVP